MTETLQKLVGLSIFWLAANFVASFLPPTAAGVAGVIVAIVLFAGLGSIILSVVLGGDGFDHLFAGFMLALPGWALTYFAFGWQLHNPGLEGEGGPLAMIKNLCILAVGMAIVAIPMLPVIWKLQKSSLEKAAPPAPPNQSSTPVKPPAKGSA